MMACKGQVKNFAVWPSSWLNGDRSRDQGFIVALFDWRGRRIGWVRE